MKINFFFKKKNKIKRFIRNNKSLNFFFENEKDLME